MNILIIGNALSTNALQTKLGNSHQYTASHHIDIDALETADVVFDFTADESPENMEAYADVEGLSVFINAPKISLAELAYFQEDMTYTLYGFNGLPTFVEREVLEVSALNHSDAPALEALCKALNTDYTIVDDRVGMATPRIIAMIINEAYFTVQEGTASKDDIDQGMKLGTNYPFGPFEWADMMGINHVYELLEAIYEDTKDERYKICPLMKKEYLARA